MECLIDVVATSVKDQGYDVPTPLESAFLKYRNESNESSLSLFTAKYLELECENKIYREENVRDRDIISFLATALALRNVGV